VSGYHSQRCGVDTSAMSLPASGPATSAHWGGQSNFGAHAGPAIDTPYNAGDASSLLPTDSFVKWGPSMGVTDVATQSTSTEADELDW